MRALVKDKNSVVVKKLPRPVLRTESDVLICIQLAGLCRTDVFVSEGKIKCKDNVILGHEFSGVVEETGAAARGFKTGDRVTVMPIIPCGTCSFCSSQKSDQCQNTSMLGIDHDGAFAEYISVPSSAVYKLPEQVSFKQGAYSEPVAASLSVMKAGVQPHQKGLIYGDNRFGHLIKRILKAYDINNVMIYDPFSQQALEENAFDFAVETMATAETMNEMFRAVKPGGKVVIKSRKHEPVGINFNTAIKKEITLVAVNYGDFREAIDLMADGRLQVDDLLGDMYELEDFAQVFERSKTHENAKIFFKPGQGDVRDR
jgi:threonine dehydrogenase-like Zn-dependent dehydrogenase